MKRPTIRELADAADLSVATVNRVLSGGASVRAETRDRIEAAATRIGFYGLRAIQSRNAMALPRYRLGIQLLQPHRPFYRLMAQELRAAAAAVTGAEIDLQIEFLEDLSPQNTVDRALMLAQTCQAICLTSAVHPTVMQVVADVQARGIPVFALISQLSATGMVHYVGLDHWKVGRTAGWAIHKLSRRPGKVGVLLGNHRFRNQEMNETGFRSYFREHAPEFTLLEPLTTFESSAVAQEMTERLLREHPDLAGLYVAGGGISGTLQALRSAGPSDARIVVGYELMENTRAALLDGTMTLAISHPFRKMADEVIQGMMRAVAEGGGEGASHTRIVPFDLWTRENI